MKKLSIYLIIICSMATLMFGEKNNVQNDEVLKQMFQAIWTEAMNAKQHIQSTPDNFLISGVKTNSILYFLENIRQKINNLLLEDVIQQIKNNALFSALECNFRTPNGKSINIEPITRYFIPATRINDGTPWWQRLALLPHRSVPNHILNMIYPQILPSRIAIRDLASYLQNK